MVEDKKTLPGATGPVKLHYFNAMGRAELVRMILMHANVDFEDVRYGMEPYGDWKKVKAENPKFKNVGLPQLEIGDKMYTES
jgi:hypothetical protein